MNSAILEIQEMATDSKTDLPSILRKALIVATKLKLTEFKTWINLELNGYFGEDIQNFPKYRVIEGKLIAMTSNTTYIPFYLTSNQPITDLTTVYMATPLPNLIHISNKDGQGFITVRFSPEEQQILLESQDCANPMEITRLFSFEAIESILNAVRTQLLNFALELEENGILGEGITFTDTEKEKAKNIQPSITINGNFQGTLGDINNSNITQNLALTIEKQNFNSLREYLSKENC